MRLKAKPKADETGTEVDEDVFSDIIEQKPDTLWMVVDAVAVEDFSEHTRYPSSNETDTPSLHSAASSSDTQSSYGDGPFFPPKRARSDDHLQEAKESCCSFEEVLGSTQTTQPYILAVGTSKSSIHDYYISVDAWLIPCMAKSSLSAFDELFKVHYVFGISYDFFIDF
ncbi:hypothetical protein QQF64_018733 [Cirrhinus molitorella]|uniref:Uncharacterized protein n=1 Tax=Cirrhinus molitorella TaxID=172907 RepID=A0ABR3LDG5_9TELE